MMPKVSVDIKLLKNRITAGGGQVQISTTPTMRILRGKAHRYVVPCQEDKGIRTQRTPMTPLPKKSLSCTINMSNTMPNTRRLHLGQKELE